jgi:hypothetical protein
MAYPVNALDWYRGNRNLIGFGGWNGFGDAVTTASQRLLLDSGLWNSDWYKQKNPDVAAAGVDPKAHFIQHGGMPAEQRDAWNFSSRYYFTNNPDVAAANVNGLLHYLNYGKKEGRTYWAVASSGPWSPPPPPPPPPSQAELDRIAAEKRQRDAEAETRRREEEARRQKALADQAQADKLKAEQDAARAKLDADQALIDASRNAADLQKQIDAQAALDKLAATERAKADADLAAARAEAAAYEASLKAGQSAGVTSPGPSVLTGQSLAPPVSLPSSSPPTALIIGAIALGALLFLKKGKG